MLETLACVTLLVLFLGMTPLKPWTLRTAGAATIWTPKSGLARIGSP
jgi:hypothetical protein